jgi:hypothetical protein
MSYSHGHYYWIMETSRQSLPRPSRYGDIAEFDMSVDGCLGSYPHCSRQCGAGGGGHGGVVEHHTEAEDRIVI